MDSFWWRYGLVAVMLPVVGAAFLVGMYFGKGQLSPEELAAGIANTSGDALTEAEHTEPADFGVYWRVWNVLEQKFVPFSSSTAASVATQDKVLHSIEGLVQSYNDPYTVFFPPKASEEFKISADGEFQGVGMVVGERDGKLVVVTPLEHSPAANAGLLPGDEIRAIDGTDTMGLSVDDAVHRIRGKEGTTVQLAIGRPGEAATLDIAVVRGRIEIPSTKTAVVTREVPAPSKPTLPQEAAAPSDTSPKEDTSPVGQQETTTEDLFVLRLYNFSKTSTNAFKRELQAFRESGSDKLIVDLRGNPGGFLNASVDIASWFLPSGTVVAREYAGPERTEKVYVAGVHDMLDVPLPQIAVLVNKGSASSAEILAAALQQNNAATVLGEQTFGKGSVQELVNVTEDMSLKVTVARWYTPDGSTISSTGLTPDIVVNSEPTASSSDPVLERAIEYLLSSSSTAAR